MKASRSNSFTSRWPTPSRKASPRGKIPHEPPDFHDSFSARRRLRQIFLRLRFALERRHLVGIDPHHKIVDVVLYPRKPVTGAGRNHDDVTGLDLVSDAVANLRTVISRTIEFDDRAHGRGTSLPVD